MAESDKVETLQTIADDLDKVADGIQGGVSAAEAEEWGKKIKQTSTDLLAARDEAEATREADVAASAEQSEQLSFMGIPPKPPAPPKPKPKPAPKPRTKRKTSKKK